MGSEMCIRDSYDTASTLYAEFGPFVAGAVGTLDEVLDAAGVAS